jgi:hypothetical protein
VERSNRRPPPALSLLDLYRLAACLFPYGLFVAIVWMRLVRRYRVENLDEIRQAYRRLVMEAKGPVLLCSTHPTLADAAVIVWACGTPWSYLAHPTRFPWIVTDPVLFRAFRLQSWLGILFKSIYVRQGAGFDANRNAIARLDRVLERNASQVQGGIARLAGATA